MLLIQGNTIPIVSNPRTGPPTIAKTLPANCTIDAPRNWIRYAITTTANPRPTAANE